MADSAALLVDEILPYEPKAGIDQVLSNMK